MDFVNKLASTVQSASQGQNQGQGQSQNQGEGQNQQNQNQGNAGGVGGLVDGLMGKVNNAAGGGPESEKDEDFLDKGIDLVQERVLKQGPQDNETAVEQAKDEQISDFIRTQYKNQTGKDFPIADKKKSYEN